MDIDLTKAEKAAFAINQRLHSPYRVYLADKLGSTNDELKRLADEGAPHGTVLIAREQTAGKGRMGRSFFSPESGLYMSLLIRPDQAAENALFFTTSTAVAVCRAIEKTTAHTALIKWVNDIYINGKKVCGILAESSISGAVADKTVIGIGINITAPAGGFPEEIAQRAGALFDGKAPKGFYETLAAAVTDELFYAVNAPHDEISAEYRRRSLMIGRFVTAQTGGSERVCRVLDITADTALVVEYENGERGQIQSGEVRIIL